MTSQNNPLAGLKRPTWKLRKVDGFAIRNFYDFPDWDVVETRESLEGTPVSELIPPGEAWIEQSFWAERELLLNVHWHEQELAKLGWDNAKIRSYLNRGLGNNVSIKDLVVCEETLPNGLKLYGVRGDEVRQKLDRQFVYGGHDLIYSYIPHNQIWWDVCQDTRDVPYTKHHEKTERSIMATGVSYERAHQMATKSEKKLRRRELLKLRPLKIPFFEQGNDMCGPASLRIAAAYFGKKFAELKLAKLCGAKAPAGTEHDGLVKGGKAIGAVVLAKKNASLDDLRVFIHERRLPVIVGWWDGPNRTREEVLAKLPTDPDVDEAHFSVVYHITRQHVYLKDPGAETGKRKISASRFLAKWWDLDTTSYIRVNRWYMVIKF